MFNFYFGFGAIVLIAFVYVNVAWAFLSANTLPPGISRKKDVPQPVQIQKPEEHLPILAATLGTLHLNEPAEHSAR